ncbi:MAG: phosphoribosylglycinamide formyltransferase [Lachnospiraceae bacterium]|nr:phosphoribosylglycinamide formyltransferase [Lachnospiraceae bacterium]
MKIAVLVSGGGTNLQAIIDKIASGEIQNTEISVVVSNNRKAYALERAKAANIPAVGLSVKQYPDREAFYDAVIETIDSYQVDLIVLAGCLMYIPPKLIQKYHNRIINIHPSLIPSFCGKGYYGLAVHEKVLERGVKVTGATVHFVDEILDNGPILLQKPVLIEDGDTPEALQLRVMQQAEWIILPQAINLLAQGKVVIEGNKARII